MRMESVMVKELWYMRATGVMRANGRMTSDMEEDTRDTLMETYTWDNSVRGKLKVMVFINGPMGKSTMGNGKRE